jgi:hypothetical protein
VATEIARAVTGAGGGVFAPQGIYVDAMSIRAGSFDASYLARSFPPDARG